MLQKLPPNQPDNQPVSEHCGAVGGFEDCGWLSAQAAAQEDIKFWGIAAFYRFTHSLPASVQSRPVNLKETGQHGQVLPFLLSYHRIFSRTIFVFVSKLSARWAMQAASPWGRLKAISGDGSKSEPFPTFVSFPFLTDDVKEWKQLAFYYEASSYDLQLLHVHASLKAWTWKYRFFFWKSIPLRR